MAELQDVQEFYVNVTQKVAKPLPAEAAAQIILTCRSGRFIVPEQKMYWTQCVLQKQYEI